MVVAVGVTLWVPLVALLPVQPPLAVQEVALVEDQVRVALWPETMLVGEAEKETVGAAALTLTVTLRVVVPPAPVQARV